MQNLVEIGQTVAEISNLSIFSRWRPSAILICWANFGTTYNENLMVFITVQNLVAITLVVLIIQKLEYFARLAWKRPFLAVLEVKIGENGQFLNSYPSRNAITRN